jgi:hypothetical protein
MAKLEDCPHQHISLARKFEKHGRKLEEIRLVQFHIQDCKAYDTNRHIKPNHKMSGNILMFILCISIVALLNLKEEELERSKDKTACRLCSYCILVTFLPSVRTCLIPRIDSSAVVLQD